MLFFFLSIFESAKLGKIFFATTKIFIFLREWFFAIFAAQFDGT
jgi:hypothetical protein